MTTPNDPLADLDILLPKSFVLVPDIGVYGVVPATIDLPQGVLTLQVNWSGFEGIRFRLEYDGPTNATAYRTMIQRSTTMVPRTSAPITVTIGVPTKLRIQALNPFTSLNEGSPNRVGLTIIPMGQTATT